MSAHHSKPFWVVGHRGSPTIAVENTIASFERAIGEGANALELDLCPLRDGHIAVWHDFDPRTMIARFRRWGLEPDVLHRPIVPSHSRWMRPTIELSLAELRERYGYARKRGGGGRVPATIPTLSTFMEWATKKEELGLVFLDIKVPEEQVGLVARIVARLDQLVEALRPKFRIVLEAADAVVVKELCRLARGPNGDPRYGCTLDVQPHPGLVFDLHGCSAVRAAIEHKLRHATPQKPRSITLWPFRTHERIVEADLRRMREHNDSNPEVPLEAVCAFTINEPEEMRSLVDLGVQGIQSDKPRVLCDVAVERGRQVTFVPESERELEPEPLTAS